MSIPAQHTHRYVYHFSHIDNLEGLLRNGFLAHNHPLFPKRHRSIAAEGIQSRRARMAVPCGSMGCVHDYVPFYFGSVSPMLLGVVNAKNVDQYDILYFEFSITLAERQDVVFTSASANTEIPPNFYHDPANLAELDWDAIDSKKWGNPDDDFRHRRMAEMLVYSALPVTAAARCVVWNEGVKERVKDIIGDREFPPIEFEDRGRKHWFTNFAQGGTSSVVKGPGEVAGIFNDACNYVAEHTRDHEETASFKNLRSLRDGLRADFGCLPHTAELVGLRSENGTHRKTVDVHTKEVVAGLLELDEYDAFDAKQKRILEIAAYLHDIGKGPRSRWDENGGLQKVDPDHPVGAMPMMAEILTEHVGRVTASSARTLLLLVCYHDLVGDVLGQGRAAQQILDVVGSEDELRMLFAIARADVTALVPWWWEQNRADELFQWCADKIGEDAE
ncbi:MAG: DarT ssDNA thymidine ADP-ribosyltransferase family protein [Hyphomonas sp.]|uniref:DUF4433 domain-containing protein n=1 Tax=Hyphomonas sp. TaxID=87 RepID=UPI003297F03F